MGKSEIHLEILKNTARIDRISDNVYFSEYKDYVSNSRLSLINPEENGSPELYDNGFNEEFKSYYSIGTAIHSLVLQPDDYVLSDIPLPSEQLRKLSDYIIRNNGCDLSHESISKAVEKIGYFGSKVSDKKLDDIRDKIGPYIEDVNKPDNGPSRLYVQKKDKEKVDRCIESLSKCRHISRLLNPDTEFDDVTIYNECTIFLDILATYNNKETVLHLKGKLDSFSRTEDTIVLNDLKTTGHRARDFEHSFKNMRYYRQAAFYRLLLENLSIEMGWKAKIEKPNFLVVSTFDYSTSVYTASDRWMKKGREELFRLLKLVALHQMEIDGYRHYKNTYSLCSLACSFTDKFKLISLLLALYKVQKRKNPNIKALDLVRKIRAGKGSSEKMMALLAYRMECLYNPNEEYLLFKLDTPAKVLAKINEIMDKELPFSSDEWNADDDLPF